MKIWINKYITPVKQQSPYAGLVLSGVTWNITIYGSIAFHKACELQRSERAVIITTRSSLLEPLNGGARIILKLITNRRVNELIPENDRVSW